MLFSISFKINFLIKFCNKRMLCVCVMCVHVCVKERKTETQRGAQKLLENLLSTEMFCREIEDKGIYDKYVTT